MLFHFRNVLRNLDFQGCRIIYRTGREQTKWSQNNTRTTHAEESESILHFFFHTIHVHDT